MAVHTRDPISEELRHIEVQIDNCYQRNSLIQLPFGTSAWYFMAFCEDSATISLIKGEQATVHDTAFFADALVTYLKNPFQWLLSGCSPGGEPACAYHSDYYLAARELFDLAEKYDPFELAFTYASRGIIELGLEDKTIVPSRDFLADTKYEAYDRLVKSRSLPPSFDPAEIADLVKPQVQVDGERFRYSLNPKLMSRAKRSLEPVLLEKYSLPDSWGFPRYSIKDFRQIAGCLVTIAFIHYVARLTAVQLGCDGLGYASSVFLATRSELIARLTRYSDCSQEVVERLVSDLTYGSAQIDRPDPALQPLIRLNERQYALMPNLLLNSSMERNFTVLLNRFPSGRAAYSAIVEEKEAVMRERMIDAVQIPGIRHFYGKIPGVADLPDIDLALLDDSEKMCVLLELKWFIEPAEPREVIEKSEEIAKGITQLLKLSNALGQDAQPFLETLRVDANYEFAFAVVSENSVGLSFAQDPRIPVVRREHLLRKLNSLRSLKGVCTWLSGREYLPVEGRDYAIVEEIWTIGRWGIRWYGLKPLIDSEYL